MAQNGSAWRVDQKYWASNPVAQKGSAVISVAQKRFPWVRVAQNASEVKSVDQNSESCIGVAQKGDASKEVALNPPVEAACAMGIPPSRSIIERSVTEILFFNDSPQLS
ncbi:MAG: hypothetical protein D6732_14240 [Methanobacteriota archaeon]|nr:MAG: hypothetical protein D6732_14240 [Euryarchaeota archaeon]